MKRGFILIVTNLLCCIGFPQLPLNTVSQTPADSVPQDYNGLRETVYMQTSKGIYEAGEDLWFKAYAFDTQTMALSARSRTLFVEMMDGKDSIVWQEKYPMHGGMSDGHIYMDKNLRSGEYRIHAYTRHSFLKDTLMPVYPKTVRVVKDITEKLSAKAEAADVSDTVARLRFFPEGGDLTDGIASKVAFKATNGRGMPVDVEGVLEEDGRVVARLESLHDGMSFFFLTPHKSSSYRAVLDDGREFPFCGIQTSGLSLRLHKQTERYLDFQLSQPRGDAPQRVRLVGRMRGMTCCTAEATLHGSLRVRMPVETFAQQGIAAFTLYDETMRPMAERLVYVHPRKRLHIEVKLDKARYRIRDKGTLTVRVTDEDGHPVRANLGLSLFDKAYIHEGTPETLLSYCYLSTEIRGNIHNPGYYFDEGNKDRLESLDLLLLTQGWRRYVWESGDTATVAAVFLSDEINGVQTIGTKKGLKEVGGTEQLVQVFGPDGNAEILMADTQGRFTVPTEQMERLRGGYVYVKPLLDKGRYKPSVAFEDLFGHADSLRKPRRMYHACMQNRRMEEEADYPVVSRDSSILLSEVTVKADRMHVFRDKLMGRLDSLAQTDINAPFVCTTCHYLINYRPDYNAHHNPIGRCPAKGRQKPVNGKPYEIAKFKYFDNGKYFIVEDRTSIIYEGPYYTEEELLRMNNIYRTKGYYGKREFYQPDEWDMKSPIPDARNTLLWLPDLVTDGNGEAEVEFYCSDINTGFVGVVEGTDGQGLLGTGQCDFWVTRN